MQKNSIGSGISMPGHNLAVFSDQLPGRCGFAGTITKTLLAMRLIAMKSYRFIGKTPVRAMKLTIFFIAIAVFSAHAKGTVLINLGFGNIGIGIGIIYRAYTIEPVIVREGKEGAQTA